MLTNNQIEQFFKDLQALNLRFPVSAIAEKTGYSKGNVSDYINRKKSVSKAFIDRFYYEFYGTKNVPHETKAEEPQEPYHKRRNHLKNNGDKKRIPFYDAPAAGSDIAITDMTAIHAPAGTIDVGDLLHDSEAAIRIYGNSMLPNYPPGCVVGLAKCNTSFIEPGEVYVIETRDRRILKKLLLTHKINQIQVFNRLLKG